MQRKVDTPKEYLACLEGKQLEIVEQLRGLIKKAAPRAKEGIKWGMLHYDLDGDLCCLAAQKQYVSLYVGGAALAEHAEALAEIDHGKGCLRFKKQEQVPDKAILALLRFAVKNKSRIGDERA
ncbi:MAG: iron chaperone [Gemmataceae bacterium]